MIKKYLFILLFITFSISSFTQEENLNDLRSSYIEALHDYKYAPGVYATFQKVQNPSAKIIAYKGALEAIMTKTTWNILKKLSYLRKSEASFIKAVEMEPESLEIRFMRMAVQYEIPSYLGFSDDMEEDRKFIVAHISNFNSSGLSTETLSEIYGFMVRCERFTENQIETFKGYLALK